MRICYWHSLDANPVGIASIVASRVTTGSRDGTLSCSPLGARISRKCIASDGNKPMTDYVIRRRRSWSFAV